MYLCSIKMLKLKKTNNFCSCFWGEKGFISRFQIANWNYGCSEWEQALYDGLDPAVPHQCPGHQHGCRCQQLLVFLSQPERCAQPSLTDSVTRLLVRVNWMIYHNSAYELHSSIIYLHKMLVTVSTVHQNVANPSKVWCKDNMFSWFIACGSYNY